MIPRLLSRLVSTSQASANPGDAAPEGAAPAGKASGLPMGKIALGCGCLLVVLLLLAVAVGAGVWYFGGQAMEEAPAELGLDELPVGLDDARRMVEAAEEASAGPDVDEEERELQPADVRAALKKPLSSADVKAYLGLIDDLRASAAYRNWKKETGSLEELAKKTKGGEETSTVDGLRAIRGASKAMEAGADVMKAFDELVRKQGGYPTYMARVVRIGGLTAAASHIASKAKIKDPASDEIAAKMLKQRPAIRAEFEKNVKEFKRLDKEGKAEAGMAMLAMQQPGVIALARMPEASFEAWKALPASTRRKLLDLQKPKKGDLPLLFAGVPTHGQALLLTAEMEALGAQ